MKNLGGSPPHRVWAAALAVAVMAGVLGAPGTGRANEDLAAAGLRAGPAVHAADVIDADTIRLAVPVDGASEVRLVGIQAPKLPLGRADFAPWPLAETARAELASLVEGRTLTLWFGPTAQDRHGRLLAHLTRDDGLWIQGALLRVGLARVYTFPDNRLAAQTMLALERGARARKAGIWSDPFYRVRRASEPRALSGELGSFQLVEGRVRNAAQVRGRVYLNFGSHWRSDFTVIIEAKALRLFRGAALDPLALADRAVRVRGWLYENGGPAMDLTHPEAIELLSQP